MTRLAVAFRANILPAVLLWCAALGLLLAYARISAVHQVCLEVAQLKRAWGLGFSMPAQALAAGVAPFLLQKLQKGGHGGTRWQHVPFLMAFWACQGGMTDLFYTLQAHLFGTGTDALTLMCKTTLDLGLYSPVLCMPGQIFAFAFKDNGFSAGRTKLALGNNWYVSRVVPVYWAALLVWTPAVLIMYSLPLPLQFPFQAIIQCFWGLVLIVMTNQNPVGQPVAVP